MARRQLGAAAQPGALAAADELEGDLAAGLVDHLVAEHDRALAVLLGGLAVGLEDVEGPVELLLGGRVDLVEHGDLVRGERPLAVVAEHARAHGVVAQRVELAHLEERAVDDLQPVGPTGHEDAAEDVVEVVAGVLGDVDAAGEHRHLDAGGEVGRAEDDRLEPGRGGADLVHVDQPARRLDLRLDPDVPDRQARLLLDLGQQQVERLTTSAADCTLGSMISSRRSPALPTTSMTSP